MDFVFFFKLAALATVVSVSLYLILLAMVAMRSEEEIIHVYLALERRDLGEHPFFFAVAFAFGLSRAIAVILALVAVTMFVLTL